MSIVIIGGHDRMVRQYRTICKEHNCKAKIFTHVVQSVKQRTKISKLSEATQAVRQHLQKS